MKTLFGNYILEYARSVNGAPVAPWKTVDVPKEGTASLDTQSGNKTEAKGDDGTTEDSYTEPGTSTLVFSLFKKKGVALPWKDDNGVVNDEWAFRIKSATDVSAPAFQLDRTQLSANRKWSKTEAYTIEYTATALKPAQGNQVKELGVDLDTNAISFSSSADTDGKSADILNYNGVVTAAAESGATWITEASVANDKVTVKVAANTGSARSAVVTVTDTMADGGVYTSEILVSQAAGQ